MPYIVNKKNQYWKQSRPFLYGKGKILLAICGAVVLWCCGAQVYSNPAQPCGIRRGFHSPNE